jgi:ribosomal protein S18 acetylase RimI-like enzyme
VARVITSASVRLATPADAAGIAAMSRDHIEHGLRWSWTTDRVERAIRDPDTNAAVVGERNAILAFGIMSYREEVAHLLLFAVRRSHQRQGIGSVVLDWLEAVARAAGITHINVECRRENIAARNFYGERGYHEQVISKGYYGGVEDAIRLEKWLTSTESR